MKKYITLAALLVAGTAFANADTVSLYDYATAANKDMKDNGWSTKNTANNVWTGFKDAGDAWRICDWNGSGTAFAYTSIDDYNNDSFSITFNIRLDSTAYQPNSASTRDDTFNQSGAEALSILVDDGTNYYRAVLGYNGSAITVSDGNNESSEARSTTFEFDNFFDLTLSFTKGTNNTFVGSVLVGNSTYSLNGSNAAGVRNAYADDVLIGTFNGANNTNVSVRSGSISSIPEPSAFGLLAGIGALALVASRRRRK